MDHPSPVSLQLCKQLFIIDYQGQLWEYQQGIMVQARLNVIHKPSMEKQGLKHFTSPGLGFPRLVGSICCSSSWVSPPEGGVQGVQCYVDQEVALLV